jgi:predicted nucleotidyltransferase component of viral defense system
LLYTETVEPGTLRILNELMKLRELSAFNLVGGTALSLQLGHRKSDDIDMFNVDDFSKREVIDTLKLYFKDRFELKSKETNPLGVFGFIDGIKVDICKHTFPLINPLLAEDEIRMWGLSDIAASKVHAISMRAKRKDFWDIDEILDHYSLEEIAASYRKKYDPMLAIGVAQILTYFDDAESSDSPVCLKNKTWETVKTSIAKKINDSFK